MFSKLYVPFLLGLSLRAASPQNCSVEQGQAYIDNGRYGQAVREFTCVIDAQPTEVAGYRGRIEAQLLLGEFSNAVRDYARITAYVKPVHADAQATILDGYAARLKTSPNSIPVLTGSSFARWWYFDYTQAIKLLKRLVELAPKDVYANLFLGSSRALSGVGAPQGVLDLDRAILLSPSSPDVRYIVADAYTYGLHDPTRAFAEASNALNWGLDTPRIHAILASAYTAFGNQPAAAEQIRIHLDQVTSQMVPTSPLNPGASFSLPLVPGRTYEVPLPVTAGQSIAIATSSHDFWDTILVLLGPDGIPVAGSDDYSKYFAGLDWTASTTGTYRMRVSSFESVDTGELVVTRK